VYNLAEKEGMLGRRSKRVLLACRDAVCEKYPGAGIVLYGSQARGQSKPESDVDLLVLLNEDVTPTKKRIIHDMLYEIGLAEDMVISTIVRSYSAWNSPISQAMPLYRTIQQEGVQLA